MPLLEITEESGFLDVLDFCERRGDSALAARSDAIFKSATPR